SGITGTGFMKCIPITWAGRLVCAAIVETEIDDVLLASTAAGGANRSSSRKILNLVSDCSVAASTTSSTSATAARLGEVRMRASAPVHSTIVATTPPSGPNAPPSTQTRVPGWYSTAGT